MEEEKYLYNDFDNHTKDFLNYAIDVYQVIKDKEIIMEFETIIGFMTKEKIKYKLSSVDKKAVALLIAGHIKDKTLRDMFISSKEYKLEDLLSLLDITLDDVKSLEPHEYIELYEKDYESFINDILTSITFSMVSEITKDFTIETIEPSVIVYHLAKISSMDFSDDFSNYNKEAHVIVNIFRKYYSNFAYSRFFTSLRTHIIENNLLKRKIPGFGLPPMPNFRFSGNSLNRAKYRSIEDEPSKRYGQFLETFFKEYVEKDSLEQKNRVN